MTKCSISTVSTSLLFVYLHLKVNTNFVDKKSLKLRLTKQELDGRPAKDKKNRLFDDDFFIELRFALGDHHGTASNILDDIATGPELFGKLKPSNSNRTPTDPVEDEETSTEDEDD